MKRRWKRASASAEKELPAVKTTIVGGRPPGCGKMLGEIPRGVEVLVKKASVDSRFRRSLLSRRSAAADEIGLVLTPAEAAILDGVPAAQLEAIISQTQVEPSKMPAFLGKAAAVMLVALGASASPSARRANAQQAPTAGATAQVDVAGLTVRPAPSTAPAPQASQPAPLTAGQKAALGKLLEQLDADKYTEREAAQKKIKAMGPAVVPALEEALKTGKLTLEVTMRVRRIIDSYKPAPPPKLIESAGMRPVIMLGLTVRPIQEPVKPDPATRPALTAEQKALLPKLIKQLGATRPEDRKAAEKKIRAIGPLALPVLRDALIGNTVSKDVKARLTTLIKAFEATTRPALTAKQKAELPGLIKRLGSDLYVMRRDAQQRIQAIGPGALPILREAAAAEKTRPNVKEQLAALIKTFEAATQPATQPVPEQLRPVRGIRPIRSAGVRP